MFGCPKGSVQGVSRALSDVLSKGCHSLTHALAHALTRALSHTHPPPPPVSCCLCPTRFFALYQVSRKDLSELKAIKKPSKGLCMLMEAVCLLLHVKPVRRKRTSTGAGNYTIREQANPILDYWSPCMKRIGESSVTFFQVLYPYLG